MKTQLTLALVLSIGLASPAFAFGPSKPKKPPTSVPAPGEPEYCVYSNLSQHEVSFVRDGLKRQRVFRFGDVRVAGLAVGHSKTEAVRSMAEELSSAKASENYCTWYHNDGDADAAEIFNHHPVERPTSDTEKSVEHYRQELQGVFAKNTVNMVGCAEKHGYIALGCDGQKHRGPSIFGMLLAFSGCTPEHAAETVNYMWGLNGVPEEGRLAVIREGHRLGQADPEASRRLRLLLSNE